MRYLVKPPEAEVFLAGLRAAPSVEKALAEIERGRGSAYDADVADACLRVFVGETQH